MSIIITYAQSIINYFLFMFVYHSSIQRLKQWNANNNCISKVRIHVIYNHAQIHTLSCIIFHILMLLVIKTMAKCNTTKSLFYYTQKVLYYFSVAFIFCFLYKVCTFWQLLVSIWFNAVIKKSFYCWMP